MHEINLDKAQRLIDTTESYEGLRLRCSSWEGSVGTPLLLLGVGTASLTICCETNTERYF